MASFNFIAPLTSVLVTEGWGMPRTGRLHRSLDMRATVGTPARSVSAGTVIYAGTYSDTTGLAVELDHGDGVLTRYLHLSRLDVSKGQRVAQGQQLGLTGFATSPHLHYDTWVLPDVLHEYVSKFGAPAQNSMTQTQTFGGRTWTKVPSEPLIPNAQYQQDVIDAARQYGIGLYDKSKVGGRGALIFVGLLGLAGTIGYMYYRTLPHDGAA